MGEPIVVEVGEPDETPPVHRRVVLRKYFHGRRNPARLRVLRKLNRAGLPPLENAPEPTRARETVLRALRAAKKRA